jgi:hypothetical protein
MKGTKPMRPAQLRLIMLPSDFEVEEVGIAEVTVVDSEVSGVVEEMRLRRTVLVLDRDVEPATEEVRVEDLTSVVGVARNEVSENIHLGAKQLAFTLERTRSAWGLNCNGGREGWNFNGSRSWNNNLRNWSDRIGSNIRS